MKPTLNILAISGSLRTKSGANAILEAARQAAPDSLHITVYEGLHLLPHFNGSEVAPIPVQDLRDLLNTSDGILLFTPEYAFGVPGSLKNAIDWVVPSGELNGKPVGLVTAATGGEKAHASMLLTLEAVGAKVPEGATLLIPFVRSRLNEAGELTDESTREALKGVLDALVTAIHANAEAAVGS